VVLGYGLNHGDLWGTVHSSEEVEAAEAGPSLLISEMRYRAQRLQRRRPVCFARQQGVDPYPWKAEVLMPVSNSKLSLSQRREKAFSLFARGYTNVDVARKLKVNKDTAANYRELYEKRIHAQAAANPGFLRDVLANTIRALEELDTIRSDAHKQISEKRFITRTIECEHCGEESELRLEMPIGDDARTKYLNVLLKAQDQRSKILGVLGVKSEVIAAMMQIKVVQDLMLKFMMTTLCANDRKELEAFLSSPEMVAYVGGPASAFDGMEDILELESTEV
jgi:hypothetical protein